MKFFYAINPSPSSLAKAMKGDALRSRRAGMINVVTTIESGAKRNAPVKTSNLANSGTNEVNAEGTKGTVKFTAKYARYVHEGTGVHGPRKARIKPVNKRSLFWPGCKHPVKSVAGIKGRPFLTKAAESANLAELYAEGSRNFMKKEGHK